MDDDPRLAKALARYQVVSAYVAADLNRGQRRHFCDQLAARTWTGPNGQPMRVKAETIRAWVRRYRVGGFEGLFDKDRPQPGVQAIPPDLLEKVVALKTRVPERTLDTLIRVMEDLGHATPGLIRRSTLHRALQARGLSRRPPTAHDTQDLDRWEAANPNDLWQSDLRTGPWLPDPERSGKVRRAWLCTFLDDHSRLVVDARFSFKEDLPNLELGFRRAIQKWGVPRKCYFDNGGIYRAHHVRAICAYLDVADPVFTVPGRPEGHGKIEAFNRLMLAFIAEVKASPIQTIDELNEALWAWLDTQYQERPHGDTGEPPLQRWRAGIQRVRYADDEALRLAFQWSERRTADKAGVFSLFGVRYQVGAALARRKIEVRFDPEALHEVEIWSNGRFAERARPLEVHPWRRPKPPAPPAAPKPEINDDWLSHLVKRRRAEQASEPDPRAWKRDADRRRASNTDDLLDLLRERLDAHVVDEVDVRAWAARFGPVDLERFGARLNELLQRLPNDLHVRVYLDTILSLEAR